MKKILCIYIAILLLAMPGVVAQVDGGLTRSGEVSTYDGTRADFLTVAGKLSRYPQLAKSGEELHYAPVVTTDSVNVDLSNAVNVFGNILFNGWYETVTAQGFQLSISSSFESSTVTEYPVIPVSSYTECDLPCLANVFSMTITDLTPDILYYVRAYATNADGTTYGEALPVIIYGGEGCPGTPTVTDHEGNVYNTVQIGTQCWTKENMRATTSPSTGTYLIPAADAGFTYTGKQARWYNNDSATYAPQNYGLLYNWNAAVDTFNIAYGETSVRPITGDYYVTFTGHRRGICPAGWHLPSDAEWKQLTNYVSSQSEYTCGGNSRYIAKALASTEGWNSWSGECYPGDQSVTANNATGFSAVPAGDCGGSSFYSAGDYAYFWSSSQATRYLAYYDAGVYRATTIKIGGKSVRCLRDETGGGTALTEPTVTTSGATDVTETSATLNGSVSNPDNVAITAQGFEWKATTGGTYTAVNATGETMTYNLTGLTAGTSYTYRAFVTTVEGTSYAEAVSFTTFAAGGGAVEGDAIPCPGTPTVTDHEGNVYNTVKIGTQCWMKENLRTTTSPSTGTYLIPPASTDYTYTGKQVIRAKWRNPDNDSIMYVPQNYGLLYNWNAAVDTFNTAYGETSVNTSERNAVSVTFNGNRRGICPEGWHLPSDAEWTQLENYVGSQNEYICSGNSSYIAKALASAFTLLSTAEIGWPLDFPINNCAVSIDLNLNNATGFSAVLAGFGMGSMDDEASISASFWSSTQYGSDRAYTLSMSYSDADVGRYHADKGFGYSIRCLRDETGGTTLPTVTTGSVSDVTATSAMCGGEVTADGGAEVTARGVCWGTSETPTVADAHTSDGTGIGTFTSSITGLTEGTTYYVRAYATNSEGTAYGDQLTFMTSSSTTPTPVDGDAIPCPGTPTVTDHEGNVYNTVQIGTQCWTKENLRTTTSPSTGTYLIPAADANYTYTGKQARWYNNDSATYAPMNYGLLYNWNAAVDTFNTAYGETSVNTSSSNAVSVTFNGHRRGICPNGWHLPSDAEWTQLTNYVGSQSEYTCSGNSNYIAKALASTEGWNSYSGECYPGDQSVTANNATGFSAVPAGFCDGSSFLSAGDYAYFWSSTQSYSYYAWYRLLYYYYAYVARGYDGKGSGFSVRCLRD